MAFPSPLFFIVTKFQDHPPPIELYTLTFLIFRVSFIPLSVRLALSFFIFTFASCSLHEIRPSFFFFFLDRVDASNFILYRMNLENIGKNFFHCSNFIRNKFYQESVKRKFKLNIFRLREKRNATTLCCNRHTISDSVI